MDEFLEQKRVNNYKYLRHLSKFVTKDPKISDTIDCPLCKKTLVKGERLFPSNKLCFACYVYWREVHWISEFRILNQL